ncbi:copper resistance protein NlpE N-terminal domain-containing protein [Lunatibacter salilacus]|uniref:copper resistance protein NlpE N-terminal domain-containing protein n=1 Tax=Lunatibacter salilacus TaxID=2483804 RepID=UPI00131BA9D6|nr:copper resistance protein NlpE N-terminal domain-containing protein [Lunatibacter salilacus]
MKRTIFTPLFGGLALLLALGCQKNITSSPALPTGDTSELSLDWAGSYTGIVPCADCEGIATTIQLAQDRTYRMSTIYQGKSEEPFVQEGTFSWNAQGNKITLNGIENGADQYLVGENILFQLDLEGNRITGNLAENYQLRKTEQVSDNPLAGKKWVLKEMMGRELPEEVRAIYLEFDEDGTHVTGFGGCNNFFGECEVKAGNRINLDKMGRTQKFCQDTSEIEDALFKAFEAIDNYTVGDDGTLSLNRARMAPLLRFKLEEPKVDL